MFLSGHVSSWKKTQYCTVTKTSSRLHYCLFLCNTTQWKRKLKSETRVPTRSEKNLTKRLLCLSYTKITVQQDKNSYLLFRLQGLKPLAFALGRLPGFYFVRWAVELSVVEHVRQSSLVQRIYTFARTGPRYLPSCILFFAPPRILLGYGAMRVEAAVLLPR